MALPGLAAYQVMRMDLPRHLLSRELVVLIEQERDEFEAVFGLPVVVGAAVAGQPRWVQQPREGIDAPSLSWDASTGTLTSHANDGDEYLQTLQLAATLAHVPGPSVAAEPAHTVSDAVARLVDACVHTYPYLSLRGIDPKAVAHLDSDEVPTSWAEFDRWAVRRVARLGDAHTSIVDRTASLFHPDYTAELDGDVVRLLIVPEGSAAHDAGVRAGWVIPVEDGASWWAQTGASPQQRGRVAARRFLALTGEGLEFRASDPRSSRSVTWHERRRTPTLDDVVQITRNTSGALLVTLRAMNAGVDLDAAFDNICRGSSPHDHLVLDLRGNTGGDLLLAGRLRDRFLRASTRLGSIAFTDGRGGVGSRRDRFAEPSASARWAGRLTVLTDASTYSAAEDFLLGLQGLDHVRVMGTPTGGGSGRPRRVRLSSASDLRVSTALTYDRAGHPVELRGIQPDAALRVPATAL